MSEHMKDHEAWAEFGDVLRLPINPETDYVGGIPWEGAGFKPELPLVDIGPGSGLTTVALAEQFPDAEIIAVEPDPWMRSMLMMRIAERDSLRARATVVPNSILDAWMPEQIGGALLFNVIYFLGGRARLAFWDRMAQVLPEGAPVLMSRAYGVVDTGEELVRTASSTMGRNTYERWRQTVPVKDGRVEITNTYKTIRGGEVVREVTTKIAPFSLDEELVVSEIPIGKFAIEELSEKYLVIRRAPDIRR
ncbi:MULTISPECIES: class I SAM-dependent methyltransferase [Dermacoccus]|uniref:class I SAM-dependent methyltransferase n=1 Tax=Dermacoccus TaxID=57495 RepID=UPI000AA7D5BE|nr:MULTISPECIES: class I SAM-dependent methyltransferase [Dermacoccus]